MQCRLCNVVLTPQNRCNAHIYPRGLLRLFSPADYGSLSIVGTDMPRSRHSPTGIYDGNILCASCDNKIGVYDAYARTFVERSILVPCTSDIGWTIAGVDKHKLKMFCLSYLWRASITSRPEFSGVSLGAKHEEQIRQMIFSDNSGGIYDYTVTLQKFSNSDNFGGILFPARTRIGGLTHYEGYLPHGYKFWVKVDSQNEDVISKLSIGAIEPVFIGNRGDFHTSQERAIMVRAARRSS